MNSIQADSSAGNVTSFWKSRRFKIVLFLVAAAFINYADRVNMSVAAAEVAKEFNWDNATMGIVMGCFLWTYAACLVPVGWLLDKYGARKVNAYGIGLWSAAAMATGVVVSLPTMILARLGLGMGEAVTWPGSGKVIRSWFPAHERGLATSLFQSGGNLGIVFAMPLVAWLVVNTGWRLSFVITGSVGFVWLYFWLRHYQEPKDAKWLSPEELAYIEAGKTESTASATPVETPKGIIGKLARQKTMWGMAISQGCMVYTQYLIMSWLPLYLMQAKGMDIKSAAWFSSATFLFASIVNIVAGKVSDMVLTQEKILRGQRRSMVILFMLMTTSVGFISVAESQVLIFILCGMAIACCTTGIGLNIALVNDLTKEPFMAGSATGCLILGGNTFGLMAPMVTGFISQRTGSFDSGFYVAGALLILGSLISFTMTRKPIVYEM